jgi:hypothetical protein
MLSIRFFRLSAVAALILCSSLAFSQQAAQHQGSIARFTANLGRVGLGWAEGSMVQLDPAKLCCEGNLPWGMYFNKVTPYIAVKIPPIDVPLPVFQLRPDEAVVVIGVTPPEAEYFSYQLYLGERTFPTDVNNFFSPHRPLLASMGDAVNLRTIKTIGPDPFNRPVVFVFTPDRNTDARVRTALRSAGYPDAIINTVVVPAPMLDLGLDPKKNDLLLIIHRIRMSTDSGGAVQAYVEAFAGKQPPLRAFRITPKRSESPRLFATPALRVRGTGRTEMNLTPSLGQLRQAILAHHEEGYDATEYVTRPIAYDGFDYIQRGANALGDTRDALYLGAGGLPEFDVNDTLTLTDDEFLIAYGPKHVATGKAIYTAINVYATDPQLPMGSVFYDKFEGSADAYSPGADLLYAYKIKRHCGGEPYCLELTEPPYQPCTPWCGLGRDDCPAFVLGDTTKLGVIWRNYVEPHTNVGAAFTEVLYDRLIKFSPRK